MNNPSENKSVLIGLIHNNDEKRNKIILASIKKLKNYLSQNFLVDFTSIGFQKKLTLSSSFISFLREIYFLLFHEKNWNQYRLLQQNTLIHNIRHIKYIIFKYLKNKSSFIQRRKKITAIEINLTDKHIRLLDRFIESGKDYLIVLEDDAILNEDSFTKILNVLNLSIKHFENNYFCVDLAGGPSFSELKLDNIIIKRSEDIIYLKKPIINTLCACIFNRNLVIDIKEKLLLSPFYRFMQADHMINALLFKLHNIDNSTYIHFDPPAIEHGSFSGKSGTSTIDQNNIR